MVGEYEPVTVLDWRLDSDPSLRWQALRDLADAPTEVVAAERARVATEGRGAQLLALQGEDGQWEGGALFPAGGWSRDDEPFFAGEVEPCINGMVVLLGAYFDQDVDGVVARLLDEQLEDGGWNCEVENGSLRSSFNTTIRVLEKLLAHERASGGPAGSIAVRRRGEEYLLKRQLFRRTGDVVDPDWLQFSFPTRWHYDVLRGLAYFRDAGDPPDPRLDEAIQLPRSKQQFDGTWLLENTHPGKVHFALEQGDGRPSRWNALRAPRVLSRDGQSGG